MGTLICVMMRPQPPTDEAKPRQTPTEPLRQLGMGPALLVLYTLGLVMLQLVLVSLGSKSSLSGC